MTSQGAGKSGVSFDELLPARCSDQRASGGSTDDGRPPNHPRAAPALRMGATKRHMKLLKDDMGTVKGAVEARRQFYFLRKDAHRVYGLQDWTSTAWESALAKHPERAAELRQELSIADDVAATLSVRELSEAVRERLSDPMTIRQWRAVCIFQNAVLNAVHEEDASGALYYMEPSILSNHLFDREFPLGVEDRIMRDKWRHAITHSGLSRVQHQNNAVVSCAIYSTMLVMTVAFFSYLLYIMVGRASLWDLAATVQDAADPFNADKMKLRTKRRGQAASFLSAASFSLVINASLDKFGLIDPSTSTVFVGMVLGGTWGFVLDNLFGSDEGFREYLWSPTGGMRYAMGTLATERYGRFVVTILFDMFFTVILFKLLFTKLVQQAGFTTSGREWIANGFCSALIAMITFMVYANMTRFEWAYPSGTEALYDQWISGPTMILATIIMNMVYLTSETRTRMGEPGINDPNVKLAVTAFTFTILLVLQEYDVIDPSLDPDGRLPPGLLPGLHAATGGPAPTAPAAPPPLYAATYGTDVHLPLKNVCDTQSRAALGVALFFAISTLSLAFVIFGTSAQSLSGLRQMCCGGGGGGCLEGGGGGGGGATRALTHPFTRSLRGRSVSAAHVGKALEARGRESQQQQQHQQQAPSRLVPSSAIERARAANSSGHHLQHHPAPNQHAPQVSSGDSSLFGADGGGPASYRSRSASGAVRRRVRNALPVDSRTGETIPLGERYEWRDRVAGQCCLFAIYILVVLFVVLFFATSRLYAAPGERDGAGWRAACEANNKTALALLGLS